LVLERSALIVAVVVVVADGLEEAVRVGGAMEVVKVWSVELAVPAALVAKTW
jgi:hypothetical protein